MSDVAASATKSSVFGATPRAELTPVFSAAVCASTGDAMSMARPAMRKGFMIVSPD
jgi:hypothetical protein